MKKLIPSLLVLFFLGLSACNNQSGGGLDQTTGEFNPATSTGSGQSAEQPNPSMQAVDFKRYANFANLNHEIVMKKAQELGLEAIKDPQIDLPTAISFLGFFYKTDFKVQKKAIFAQLAFYRFTLNASEEFEIGIKYLATIISYFQDFKRFILADSVFLGIKIENPVLNDEILTSVTNTLHENLAYIFKSETFTDERKVEFKKVLQKLASSLAFKINNNVYFLMFTFNDTGLQFNLVEASSFNSFKAALDQKGIEFLYADLRKKAAEFAELVKEGKFVYYIQYNQILELLKYISANLGMEGRLENNTMRETSENIEKLWAQAREIKAKIIELKKELEELVAAGAGRERIDNIEKEIENYKNELLRIEEEIKKSTEQAPAPAVIERSAEEDLAILKKKADSIETELKELDERGLGDSEEAKRLRTRLDELYAEIEKGGK